MSGYACIETRYYWVESINVDEAEGRCGFVHEKGGLLGLGFIGNHIDLPADVEVLNSPDYAWCYTYAYRRPSRDHHLDCSLAVYCRRGAKSMTDRYIAGMEGFDLEA